MRMMRRREITGRAALAVLVALGAIACSSGGEVTTIAGGPAAPGSAPPPGTIILADSKGEVAAEGLGKIVATTPETTEAPTTTAPPTTAAPIVVPTTARPVVPGPTTPQTTQALPTPTLPQVTQPVGGGKQAPVQMSAALLSGDEQALFNAVNGERGGQGKAAFLLEREATEAARTHTNNMKASGASAVPVPNILNAVDASYTSLTSMAFRHTYNPSWVTDLVATAKSQVISQPFTFIGVGVVRDGGLLWVTIIVGS